MINTITCPNCGTVNDIGEQRPVLCRVCGLEIDLVADLFCGAGGSSTGAERAVKSLGATLVLTCVNHWPLAIETHRRNHPTARHYIEDISKAKPRDLVPEGYLDLLMASPECTHFSRARGGRPVNDQSRMNPWAVVSWLTELDVRCLLVENVPEFTDWGPVGNGIPDKAMKGIFFEAWTETIRKLGYKFEYRFLNAADYGDATTRRRFFLIARKDGVKIRWPEPSHHKTGEGGLPRWRAAREIIDWNNHGRSLLDDPKYIKRPLSINTRKRIARGLEKYGGRFAPLYIQLLDLEPGDAGGTGTPEGFTIACRSHAAARGMDEPVQTVTASNGGGNLTLVKPVAEPFITPNFGEAKGQSPRVHSVDAPVPTITRRGAGNLIEATAAPFQFASRFDNLPHPVDDPVPSITNRRVVNLVEPVIIQTDQTGSNGDCVKSPGDPLITIITKQNIAIAKPVMVQVNHGDGPADNRTQPVEEPFKTMTTHRNVAVAVPELKTADGDDIDPRRLVLVNGVPHVLDIRFRMLNNPELARAMGFDDEETRYEFLGTVAEVTKQIGNAVPVNLAAALVKAILGGSK